MRFEGGLPDCISAALVRFLEIMRRFSGSKESANQRVGSIIFIEDGIVQKFRF